jgi:hypothetical protein
MKTSGRVLTTLVMLAGATVPLAPILAQVVAPNADFHRFIKAPRVVDPEISVDAAASGVATQATEPRSGGPFREAPAAFDNRTIGFDNQGPAFDTLDEDNVVALRSFNDNRFIFEEVETVADGLGPTFNAQACRECHQNIVTGGASQVAEHRTGRLELLQFVESIGGSLIQSRSTHPDIFERVPFEDSVGTLRISTNTLGAGFIEAIANDTLLALRNSQPAAIRGTALEVAVLEANNAPRIGRFGWKSQHASLQSFAADAYLNEMGITTPLLPETRCSRRWGVRVVTWRRCARRRPGRASMAGHCGCAMRWATRSSTRTATSCFMTSARVMAFRCCRARSSRRPRRRSVRRHCGRYALAIGSCTTVCHSPSRKRSRAMPARRQPRRQRMTR